MTNVTDCVIFAGERGVPTMRRSEPVDRSSEHVEATRPRRRRRSLAALAVATTVLVPVAASLGSSGVAHAQTSAPARGGCARPYKVVAGDSWLAISRAASVNVKDLLKANRATARTKLYPGRTVCLPKGATAPSTTSSTSTTTTTTTTSKAGTSKKSGSSTTSTSSTTTTTAPKRTYTRAEVEAIIRQVWPADLADQAVAIATRESNLVPTAQNSCCIGLFQLYYGMHRAWMAQFGVTSAAQLTDPLINAYVAYALYLNAGWAPWSLGGTTTTTSTTVPG
jgi:hypothetical protein